MDNQRISTKTLAETEMTILKDKITLLENENFHLKSLIDLLPGSIYWKDINGVWVGLNKHCAQDLQRMGCLKEGVLSEVLGKTDFELFNQATAEGYRQNDIKVMESETELSNEEIIQLPNGEKLVLRSTKSPLWDKNGNVVGIVGNTIDITYLKKIEDDLKDSKNEAEAANRAKTEFLSNMRHDIRTPLSGIVGFSEILKTESKDLRIKEYANNLVASSHALLALMDEVLEAVRVGSGEMPILKRKFNLAQLFEQVVALYKARALEKNLELSLHWDHNLPHFVIGDKIRVHRIALELIANALNFTEKGFVRVRVDLEKHEGRQLVIKLTVNDSGIGIPKEKQQEIYVQFKRLTPSYQGIYKGTGLGLYVVKQFIDELEGEIYVESELHKGSSFTCLFPLQESPLNDNFGTDRNESYTPPPDITSAKAKNTNILVVEDNQIAQSVARALLSNLSCQVDVAANGIDALNLYKKNDYDLIFMDISLGEGMDGYEVTQKIRHQESDDDHTPIIALTAHAVEEHRQQCIESGIDAVLTKPLTHAHATDILQMFVPARRTNSSQLNAPSKRDLPAQDEQLFHLNQFALLDQEQALKNCGNHIILTELLTLMITQELPTDLEQMNKAYQQKDFATVEKIAHKIKGGAVYVGTTRMKIACQYLERYCKTGEYELFDKLYHQAVNVIEDTSTYIATWLKKSI